MHTGDVQLRDEGNYAGPTINKTARMRDLAHGGQTVMSSITEELVEDRLPDGAWLTDLGRHSLRDLPRPVRVAQLCHPDLRNDFPPLRTSNTTAAHHLPEQLTTFVGRGAQILRADLDPVVERGDLAVGQATHGERGGLGREVAGRHAGRALDGFRDRPVAAIADGLLINDFDGCRNLPRGSPSRLALSATALELSEKILSAVGGAAGAAGSERAIGALFGRVPAERPLGRGEVTTTRGSSVFSFGRAVSARLELAASIATSRSVNDDVMVRIRRIRPRLRPLMTGSIPTPLRRTPRHRDAPFATAPSPPAAHDGI